MANRQEILLELLKAHKERLDSIDGNLREHMRRTDLLESLHRDNQVRIESLEEPKKAREYLFNMVLDTGKIVSAIVAVLAVLRYLGKI